MGLPSSSRAPRTVLRRLLRVTLALVVLLTVAGGAAAGWIAWRLREGPLPLDLLVPRVKAALAEQTEGWSVDLAGLELAWVPTSRQLELHARGIRLARPSDGVDVRLDALRVRVKRRALLRGAVVVTAVEFDGPTLRLVRDADGHVALRQGEAEGGTRDLDWLWAMMRRLERVAVRNGRVLFLDETTRTVWALPAVEAEATRDGGPVTLEVTASLLAAEATIPLRIDGLYKPERGTLALQASSPGADTAAAFAAWPETAAPKARAWVVSNLTGGRVGQSVLAVNGHVERDDGWELVVDSLDAVVPFEGLTVRYVDTMPRAVGVAGRATFTREGLDVAVTSGRLDQLDLHPARVRVAWPRGVPPRLAVDVRPRGPLVSLLAVLDHEPIGLGKRLGLKARGNAGTADARVRLAFPLAGRPKLGALGLRASATIADATLPQVAGEWDVRRGDLRVSVSDHAAAIDGTAELRGVPARVRIRDHLHPVGGRRIELAARLDDAQRAALGLDPGAALTGPVDASVRIATRQATTVVDASADLTPAAIAVGALAMRKAPGAPGRAVARIALAGSGVGAVEHFAVTAGLATVSGSAARSANGGPWSSADAVVTFALPDRPDDPPTLDLAFRRGDAGAWRLTLGSRNVGECLRAYGYENARGGRLAFEGTLDPAAAGLALEGKLTVETVTLSRVPWMVKLVSLASLRGLLELGSEQDVELDRVVATFAHRPPALLEVRDAVAHGPKLGLRLAGTIDTAKDTVDLDGTIIPSYYLLNEGVDRIPVVGGILKYATGGAVQAVTFTVRGSRAEPAVSVQPLSSLAPGVTREWLRKLGL